ncbi:ABC transporter permease subunit [Streptomyces sp. TLI_105]|uniref:ABC transporter permease subunit n=1 Tax=Streptomyces sp. TLI_105 TaxID=1881019 RepID=UPI00089552CF|nr:ABC transporter permease subunit [Streptomyces sp. TLI_105]SEC85295.1 ABC-2 family transporter protein [Streptomyces sp. TLI_105]
MPALTKPVPPSTRSTPPARFRDLLAAEWIKLWSLRSTPWAFVVGAVAALGVNLNATLADYRNYPNYPEGIRELFVPIWAMRDAFTLGGAMVFTLATGSIGALMIVGEYGTGQIRTTFAAVPARRAVVAAKALVLAAVMLVYGTVVAGVSFAATQAVLDGRGVGMAIGDEGVLRAVAASALLAPVCALAGFGLGALLRHTATTIVSLTGLLLLLPALMGERDRWGATFLHALPQGAWKRLTEVGVSPVPVEYPWTAGGAWTVYAAWVLGAVAVAFVAVHRRDV